MFYSWCGARIMAIVYGVKPVIGDGNAMGVSAEIFNHLLGPCKYLLCVDHPCVSRNISQFWPLGDLLHSFIKGEVRQIPCSLDSVVMICANPALKIRIQFP